MVWNDDDVIVVVVVVVAGVGKAATTTEYVLSFDPNKFTTVFCVNTSDG